MNLKGLFYSEDQYFIEVFSDYVSQGEQFLSLKCFTSGELALKYYNENQSKLDFILAESSFLKELPGGSCVPVALFSKTLIQEKEGVISTLNIYQKSTDILADLNKILTAHLGNHKAVFNKNDTKIITFFSTQGGSGKTTLAYLTAKQAADQSSRAAYINFEPVSYTDHLYSMSYSTGMEEILFAVKDGRNLAPVLLAGFTKNQDNVQTLPPIRSLHDLLNLSREEVEKIMESFLDLNIVDYLFVDLGAGFSELNLTFLEKSDVVILVYSDDETGQGKLKTLLADPGYKEITSMRKAKLVKNKCEQKTEDSRFVAMFPYSQSLANGMRPSELLNTNLEFARGCSQLMEIIEEGR